MSSAHSKLFCFSFENWGGISIFTGEIFFPSNKLHFKQVFFSPEHIRRSHVLTYNK